MAFVADAWLVMRCAWHLAWSIPCLLVRVSLKADSGRQAGPRVCISRNPAPVEGMSSPHNSSLRVEGILKGLKL